jgi:hypothetical protein
MAGTVLSGHLSKEGSRMARNSDDPGLFENKISYFSRHS